MDLDLVLSQEEELWALKTRIKWMVFRDRNTSFYHLSTLVGRKRNCISTMKNNVGKWMFEERKVMEHINKSFMELYSTSHDHSWWQVPTPLKWQLVLSNRDSGRLDCEVTYDEIKATLWSLKVSKAPGLDGLHASFFQQFWLIIRDLVKAKAKKVFREKRIPSSLNKTHIASIPKM